MYCSKCGTQNPPDAQFCCNCGNEFSSTAVSGMSKNDSDRSESAKMTKTQASIRAGIATSLIVLCTPIGIYSAIQGVKLSRSYQIGDYETAETCWKRIKISWLVAGIFYAVIILLAVFGVFEDA